MWDNREGKRNPKAPDFKCKDRGCDGVIWPPRTASASAAAAPPQGIRSTSPPAAADATITTSRRAGSAASGARVDADGMPLCPVCGAAMWDDRLSKRNPRAPDFKCRNKPRERGGPGCEGVIWPARDGSPSPYPPSPPRRSAAAAPPVTQDPPLPEPPAWDAPPLDDDDVPF